MAGGTMISDGIKADQMEFSFKSRHHNGSQAAEQAIHQRRARKATVMCYLKIARMNQTAKDPAVIEIATYKPAEPMRPIGDSEYGEGRWQTKPTTTPAESSPPTAGMIMEADVGEKSSVI
jgi:hypothetical protein